jgi:hypothetical protein
MEPTRAIDSNLLDNADRFGDPFFRRFTLRHAPWPLRLEERVEKNYLFPTFYADVTCSIGIFLCDYAAAATLMPDRRMKPVRMTRGRALVTLASYVYRNVMGVPPYNEIAMTIPVMVDSWFRPPVLPMILDVFSGFGFYVFGMPVTSLENKIRGNRIWGLPKTLNRIDISDEGDECETAAFEDDGVTPLLTLRTPTTGTPTEFDVGSNIYSVLDGRLHRARTCFRGTFNVTKHMGQLVKKGTLPDTHALEIGDGPGAHVLRSLHIERQAFQFRFARSMNACFDLPDPGFG